jgi:hypothetical protein
MHTRSEWVHVVLRREDELPSGRPIGFTYPDGVLISSCRYSASSADGATVQTRTSGSAVRTSSGSRSAATRRSSSPARLFLLKTEPVKAIMDALDAHTMSSQALASDKVQQGLKHVLLNRAGLYEALRQPSATPF